MVAAGSARKPSSPLGPGLPSAVTQFRNAESFRTKRPPVLPVSYHAPSTRRPISRSSMDRREIRPVGTTPKAEEGRLQGCKQHRFSILGLNQQVDRDRVAADHPSWFELT
jgi:hypothetical protein